MSRVILRSLVLATLTAALAACHHDPPAVAPTPNADSLAAANARRDAMARTDAARRDSMARADAAARAAADADAARRRTAADADAARRRAEAAAEADRATIGAKIFFDYYKSALRSDATSALDAKIPVLQRNRSVRIRIEGNTDERGSPEYNLALGQRRAAQAMQYLVGHGIDQARVEIVSYGKEHSVCMDHAESCWQQNRRDEFVITTGTVAASSSQQRMR
jgi:peptidoglycan-associated lipoprotein